MSQPPRPWVAGMWSDEPSCPRRGFACFGDFPSAALTVFTASTLDSWSDTMLWCMDAANDGVAGIFFVSLIWFLAFNVMNLFVVGVYEAFATSEESYTDLPTQATSGKSALSSSEEVVVVPSFDPTGTLKRLTAPVHVVHSFVKSRLQKYRARNVIPLNPLSLGVRKMLVHPAIVDECGTLVSSNLILRAHRRNLEVIFGPEYGHWQLVVSFAAGLEAESVKADACNPEGMGEELLEARAALVGGKVFRPETVLCRTREPDPDKQKLRAVIDMFCMTKDFENVDERDLDRKEIKEDHSYFASGSALIILGNVAVLAMRYFDGSALRVLVPHDPSDNCCNADCSESSAERCPRGILVMSTAWTVFINRSIVAFNFIFTIEIGLKMFAAWSIPRFLLSRFTHVVDLLIILCSDIFSFLMLIGRNPNPIDLTLFRCVLRVSTLLRAVRSVPLFRTIDSLVEKALNTLNTVGYVMFLLATWHILCALLAMQIFTCSFQDDLLCGSDVFAGGTCPEMCSRRVGNRCIFSEAQMYEHCPWEADRNFNSFGNALLQLFFITTGDNNWISILINGMRSNESIAAGLVFFLIFFFISYGFLYSLLIVVIIMAFDPEDRFKLQLQKTELKERVFHAIERAAELSKRGFKAPKQKPLSGARKTSIFTILYENSFKELIPSATDGDSHSPHRKSLIAPGSRKASTESPNRKKRKRSSKRRSSVVNGARRSSILSARRASVGSNVLDQGQQEEKELLMKRTLLKAKLRNKDLDIEDAYKELRDCHLEEFLNGKYDVDPDKPILWGRLPAPEPGNLRWYIQRILNSAAWSIFLAVTIMASTGILFIQSTVPSENLLDKNLARFLDVAFFCIFALEMVLKMFSHGIWESNQSYFKQYANYLEFGLVLLQAIDLLDIVRGIAVFRVLRSLRILRTFSKIKSLQLLLLGLADAAYTLVQIILIWLGFLVLFSVIGMYLFNARLQSCNDGDFVGGFLNPGEAPNSLIGWRENCVGTYLSFQNENGVYYVSPNSLTAVLKPRVWANPHSSPSGVGFEFDTILTSAQSLFEISTLRHWSNYAFVAGGVTSIGQQPVQNAQKWSIFFFISWIIISQFFLFPLMLSAVVNGIRSQLGTGNLINIQRNWKTIERKMRQLGPKPSFKVPEDPTRTFLLSLSLSNYWQGFFAIVLLINACLMATDHYDQTKDWAVVMSILNWTFVSLYLVEMGVKFLAEGQRFFFSAWNLFDGVGDPASDPAMILFSIIELVIGSGLGLYFLRIIRIFRIARLLRLVRRLPRLRFMIKSLVQSLFAGCMNAVFLGTVTVIYAIVGNSYLSAMKFGFGINRRLNFDSPLKGMLLLFVVFTGDEWQTYMRESAAAPPLCTNDEAVADLLQNGYQLADETNKLGDCGPGSVAFSYGFFDSFFFLGFNVLRALVLGVQIENVLNYRIAEKGIIRGKHLRSFQSLWGQFDPELSGKIPLWAVRHLIFKLAEDNNPLGWFALRSDGGLRLVKLAAFRSELEHKARESGCPPGEEEVDFTTVLVTLGMYTVGQNALPQNIKLKRKAELELLYQDAIVRKLQAVIRGKQVRKISGKEARARQPLGVVAKLVHEPAQDQPDDFTSSKELELYKERWLTKIYSTENNSDIVSLSRFKASRVRAQDVKLGEYVLGQCALQDMERAVMKLRQLSQGANGHSDQL